MRGGSAGLTDALEIIVCVVERTESLPDGGHVAVNRTYADVRFVPHIWVMDRDGKTHHFVGDQFENVHGGESGHQLIVVRNRSSGNIIRVCNQTMGTTIDTKDLIPKEVGPGSFIIATCLITAIGILPVMVVYMSIFTPIGEAMSGGQIYRFDLGWHFPIVLVMVLALCAWLMSKWVSVSRAKVAALSKSVDDAFAEKGLKS